MNKVNLKQETLKAIKNLGYKPEDIRYIADSNMEYLIPIDKFWEYADFEYDSQESHKYSMVNENLIIGFRDGSRLVRDRNSGGESWTYKQNLYDRMYTDEINIAESVWGVWPNGIYELVHKDDK